MFGIWDYIKNSGAFPSRKRWAMNWVGMMTGKHVSRRLVGDHTLTQLDLANGGRFNDAVASGGWTMDNHVVEGFNRPDLPPTAYNPVPEVSGEIGAAKATLIQDCFIRDTPDKRLPG